MAKQGPDGSWQHGTQLSDTCFALLFLDRATSGGRRGPITGEDDSGAETGCTLKLAATGDGPTRVWIDGWNQLVARILSVELFRRRK